MGGGEGGGGSEHKIHKQTKYDSGRNGLYNLTYLMTLS